MGKFTKWIAGGLGWAFLGPIGGIMGFVLGSIVDESQGQKTSGYSMTTTGSFVTSLLVLVAAVMKADEKLMRSELNYVKDYFVRNFGKESAEEAIQMLRDILKQNIPVKDVTEQIRKNLDYSSRLQLLHFLYGVAGADGSIHQKEQDIIDYIASGMGISDKDTQSIKSMFIEDTDYAYRILEVEPSATDQEVKKAYRKMANKYHPDKVSHLGEDFQKAANQKFQKVNEAYEKIRKERHMN
ncbi:MAG: TerB family tellurite resistance protein [Bacteroidales bacterium]|nr:TerB family tellurite resistance protein [Bacteroidales bacterium]